MTGICVFIFLMMYLVVQFLSCIQLCGLTPVKDKYWFSDSKYTQSLLSNPSSRWRNSPFFPSHLSIQTHYWCSIKIKSYGCSSKKRIFPPVLDNIRALLNMQTCLKNKIYCVIYFTLCKLYLDFFGGGDVVCTVVCFTDVNSSLFFVLGFPRLLWAQIWLA